MNTEIDISQKNLKTVIKELWDNANYSSIYSTFDFKKPEFIWEEGIKDVKPGGYIEIFCGKILKIKVLGKKIDISGYDNLYGRKKAFEIISKITD